MHFKGALAFCCFGVCPKTTLHLALTFRTSFGVRSARRII